VVRADDGLLAQDGIMYEYERVMVYVVAVVVADVVEVARG
jgi:hypothetical protein